MKLIGSNGYDVGSPEYFKNINQSSIVGDIMWEYSNGSHCVDYKDALDKLCKSVVEVIYEVHSDLKRYAEVLSFFPKEEREETLKFLEKINEVLKFGYSNASTFDACKAYLTLSAYDTRRKSYESMSRVEEAAKKVENGYKVSFSTGMEYIRKALDYGISFTIGDDSEKKAFFDDVLDGKDKDFLQDVYNFLKFKKEKSSLQGKCFKTILSKDYIEKLTSEAISSRLYDKLKYERSYYEVIKSGFETVAGNIKKDLQREETQIKEGEQNNFVNAIDTLDKIVNVNIRGALQPLHLERDIRKTYTAPYPDKVYDYVYKSRYEYYILDEREKSVENDEDRYFVEYEGVIYPANSKESVTLHEWSSIDIDFLNDEFISVLEEADKKRTGMIRILTESVQKDGDINFKMLLDKNELFLIEGTVYNRNEAGNFMWTYFLEKNGYSAYFTGLVAQAGTLVLPLLKLQFDEIRFDESWDRKARWAGYDYYYDQNNIT